VIAPQRVTSRPSRRRLFHPRETETNTPTSTSVSSSYLLQAPEVTKRIFFPAQLSDLSKAILVKGKEAAPLSDLNSTVWLLREALALYPPQHHHRSDSLNDLAEALVARFWHVGQDQDLSEAFSLCEEANKMWSEGEQSQNLVCYHFADQPFSHCQ
jgi:hypothetical protein